MELHGFNNLAKTLSCNIHTVFHAGSARRQRESIGGIDRDYKARRLAGILSEAAGIIGAQVLNAAYQDYEPQGASAALMIAEESMETGSRESVVGHLDKSHVTVHTYPESHPDHGIHTFRADIEVSTCGEVSPLRALDHLIRSFDSHIVNIDYRVRGFTRDVRGRKHFMDHPIESVRNFIAADIRARYHMMDVNHDGERNYRTRMRLKNFELNDHLRGVRAEDLPEEEAEAVRQCIQREILEIFHGRNLEGREISGAGNQ